MKVRDLDNIFGTPMDMVKTYATRYRVSVILCLILDAVLAIIGGILLTYRGDVLTMIELAIIITVIINVIILGSSSKSEYNNIFRFYLKRNNTSVELFNCNIDATALYSILTSMGYKSVKPDKTLETYIEVLNGCCSKNLKYAKKAGKLLKAYVSDEGNFKAYVTSNNIFVSVKEEVTEDEYN